MSINNQVINNLKELKLNKMSEVLNEYLDIATRQGKSTIEILKESTDKEFVAKAQKTAGMNMKMAHFPFLKTIKDFCSIDCFWFTRNKKHMESLAHIFLVDIEEDIDEPLEKGSELVLIDINSALDYLKLPYQRKALELYLTEYGDLL